MTNEPLPDEIAIELGELRPTLEIQFPQLRSMGEIDAKPRSYSDRNEFVYCAVKYALYCIHFD